MIGEVTVVWDSTGPRHLGAAGRHDVLVTREGLTVPRAVIDVNEPSGEDLLTASRRSLSEIAAAEGHFRARFRRAPNEADWRAAENLARLRSEPELRVVDLTEDETEDAGVFASDSFAHRQGLLAPLGKGEAAVLAVAMNRDWRAGLDDRAARWVAEAHEIAVVTTREWLVEQVQGLRLTAHEARGLYSTIRRGGFWGPEDLWSEPES